MGTQLGHIYSVNRTSANPMNVILTPLDGRLRERMDGPGGGHHLGWNRVTTLYTPLPDLWKPSSVKAEHAINDTESICPTTKGKVRQQPNLAKESAVYLTADSPNILDGLAEGQTYIIGGIVDHNRYKVGCTGKRGTERWLNMQQNLCFGIANEHSIRHAALPISQYIDMASRKVLTVNQCFEIMHRW